MKAALAMLLLGVACCGCVSPRTPFPGVAGAQQLSEGRERYVVAAVVNVDRPPPGHAGSSPRGYDGPSAYGATPEAIRRLRGIEADFGLREVQAWPIRPLHMHCAVLQLPAGADRDAVLEALSRDRRVVLAQPLQGFETRSAAYDDPYVDLQRGFRQMNVAGAHVASRGEGVRVAIVDTGADTGHPDLAGVIAQTGNFVDTDVDQFRRDRHGTELAGIISAVANNREGIVGIAPGARLYVYKACWQLQAQADAARCNSFTLAQALTAAIDARVQVVNLSLSGPADPLLQQLISAGRRRGILFVAAAPSDAGVPGAFSGAGVIAVANGGRQGEPGSPLRAPGNEILTLLPGGHYDFASGVSLATAHVTGTVALLLARNPHLSAGTVYQVLRDSTSAVGAAPGTDGGDESINACAAVTAVTPWLSCP